MTDTTTTPAPAAVPVSWNINVVQIVTAGAVIAAAFGLKISPELQAAIVSLLVAAGALVTWYLHTFTNRARTAAHVQAAFAAGAQSAANTAAKSQGP